MAVTSMLLRIDVKLAAVILPAALPAVIRSAASKLVGMTTRKLGELLQ
jgi:hypothetical protein